MATGYYTPTGAAVDAQVSATAWEAEANISAAEVIGTAADPSAAVIVASEVLSNPGMAIFKITGTAVIDITNAATAVGGFEVASGYPAPA